MAYLYLALAIVAEVVGTMALKESDEFTKLIPILVVAVGFGASFYLFTLVIRTIPVGITYALWAGLGVVLVVLMDAVLHTEIPDIPAVIGIVLIIAGVVIINLFSKTTEQ